jgi:hypothetical protein
MMEEECAARRSATLLSDDSPCVEVEAEVEAAPRRSCFPPWRWKCRAPPKKPAEPAEPPGPE